MEETARKPVIGPYIYTKEKADRLYGKLYKMLIDGGLDEESARDVARLFAPPV
jgi:hypothetical protein